MLYNVGVFKAVKVTLLWFLFLLVDNDDYFLTLKLNLLCIK